ncbi:similar to Saccharomyces cerevisiae YDL200C MGT1 DNA repair methyltransferase (6-O- methylguanine-DNA methylase) involved in protection against DNA alkylation damage [Maudiozyma barnettii]|uniref:Methylated-DNA--protein-cysteine methyltransferase n=1 Tax=Maudiozyma barnettii TaxID=61262 RepID=A0A8H2VGE0_9SACH|nr:uncharacterized protein KABA2_05S09966 [Kazachstania barnettii]CAB4255169.1 similar to Saccharomyces cerevisiae YDL200C MGT1 DNA repair methyltransferase (6-O- methylguanine-DNA methylase) involved in protection against DNA alkylation damage [Kazachstania barnettii]CAD1783440.1 similar to Saccharomyces cerevisiae YDL200C MGT1 DNA repair methyltransferase (6-O- methylguanine-DNA methylase) involved in protection against DNA alkylation damage [Kazachstania barnettii]
MIKEQTPLVYKFVDTHISSVLLVFKQSNGHLVYGSLSNDRSRLFKIVNKVFQQLSKTTHVTYKFIRDTDDKFESEATEFIELMEGARSDTDCIHCEYLFGTEFQRKVWDQLVAIPYGQTRSYGQIASALGDIKKSRAVGRACGANNIPVIVPCHRVLGGTGDYVSFKWGVKIKKELLVNEGYKPLQKAQ